MQPTDDDDADLDGFMSLRASKAGGSRLEGQLPRLEDADAQGCLKAVRSSESRECIEWMFPSLKLVPGVGTGEGIVEAVFSVEASSSSSLAAAASAEKGAAAGAPIVTQSQSAALGNGGAVKPQTLRVSVSSVEDRESLRREMLRELAALESALPSLVEAAADYRRKSQQLQEHAQALSERDDFAPAIDQLAEFMRPRSVPRPELQRPEEQLGSSFVVVLSLSKEELVRVTEPWMQEMESLGAELQTIRDSWVKAPKKPGGFSIDPALLEARRDGVVGLLVDLATAANEQTAVILR